MAFGRIGVRVNKYAVVIIVRAQVSRTMTLALADYKRSEVGGEPAISMYLFFDVFLS
jgi:hypothetical protein